jgi:flavin reductase (DIM6/NTAB) family NADH-FMN oxidoreductase RutF
VVSGDELRAVMRRFPAGVAVITVDLHGERIGLTVGSLVSLSLDPPLVGVSIRQDAALHELLRDAREFGVSLLAAGQEEVAAHFARGVPPIALWHGVAVRANGNGAPLLEGALGWLRCRVRGECDAGDHTLFIGEVLVVEEGAAGPPLLYLGGRYVSA